MQTEAFLKFYTEYSDEQKSVNVSHVALARERARLGAKPKASAISIATKVGEFTNVFLNGLRF
jgi:hypothetical protein